MNFKNNSSKEPLDKATRLWLEDCFIWLINTFGRDLVQNMKVLYPNNIDFPIVYDGSEQTIIDTMKIIAKQMHLNSDEIKIIIYDEGQRELDTGSVFGTRIFLENVDDESYSAGLYLGRQEDGKFHIAIESKNIKNPEIIVSIIAHEIAHIKLLGENRIEENDEDLTDLTTLIFGIGIFNANASFQSYRNSSSWGWSKTGYLSEMEWGYALALFAFFRNENEPKWLEYLNINIKSDFQKSIDFIIKNPNQNIKSIDTNNTEKVSDELPVLYTKVDYKCKLGILSIKQKHHFPNFGEEATLNGIIAPSGKYKVGWFHTIHIIDGKVA